MSQPLDLGIVSSLVISAAILAHSYPSSFAYDRPIHTVVFALGLSGSLLLILSQSYPHLFRAASRDGGYTELAEEETGSIDVDKVEDRRPNVSAVYKSLGSRAVKLLFVLSVCALTVRIEFFRRISKTTECTVRTPEVWLPFCVALYDAIRFQKKIPISREDSPDASIYDWAYEEVRVFSRSYRWRYVPCSFLLCAGASLATHLWDGLRSTYICPVAGHHGPTISSLQYTAFLLDVFLACAFLELTLYGSSPGLGSRKRGVTQIWAPVVLIVAVFWIGVGTIYFFLEPQHRGWLMALAGPFRIQWFKAATWQAALFTGVFVCSAYCILHFGALGLVMLLTSIFTLIPALKLLWTRWLPFPPMPASSSIWSFLFIYSAWVLYGLVVQSVSGRNRVGSGRYIFYFILVLLIISPSFWKSDTVNFHPIDLLIYEARFQHANYMQYQTQSHSLEDAVAQYRRRYSLPPPPGFDKWYEYAHNRSCVVIDQYDQIHDDLLPWRGVSPSYIRQATWEAVSNPWNEISGISIRNGVASVMPNVIPTHRWMLEGIAKMIEPFQQYLPDMDLAFNINDESRVAVPHGEIQGLTKEGEHQIAQTQRAESGWSENRSSTWEPVSEEPRKETKFKNLSFRQTFYAFGSVGCPPSSSSLKRSVHSLSRMCLECAAPHSIGQFVSNWSYAADICHQPDMAHLHGFYLSPAAFKTANTLQPVFSQSKPHGYNDILYPSAWNYQDKVRYAPAEPIGQAGENDYYPGHPDPPFSKKQNVLFWRGATSEGVAEGAGRATWRGMARQRLVHLANNLTGSDYDRVSILLPKDQTGAKYKYKSVSGPDLKTLGLPLDVHIVDRIARCGGVDCDDQGKEFALVKPSDFQDHWQYRYLFDLDGAGFSGRFLPFLQSRSLPFKTALFREWYDDRLTAWHHFVPQDLRLHGVHSTLAYFAGINGTLHGKHITMQPHLGEAEMIAEQGRDWASKVLRKEDMEVYFFRLLLEWGRLTDDRREEIGYVYKAGDANGL